MLRTAVPNSKRRRNVLLFATVLLLSARVAHAEGPEARTGFQMHYGMSAAIPAGNATGAEGDDLSARYSWQFVLMDLGLGAKVTESIYVGGFLGIGLGVEGSDARVERACDDNDSNLENDIACSAASFHLGLEMRYGFAPGAKTNPWIGYGIGVGAAEQTIHDRVRGRREETWISGLEWARLSAGADIRLGRIAGLGPAVTMGLGHFDHTRTEVNGETVFDGPIEDKSVHAWITVGLRWVVLP